jgi:hypothetical protein
MTPSLKQTLERWPAETPYGQNPTVYQTQRMAAIVDSVCDMVNSLQSQLEIVRGENIRLREYVVQILRARPDLLKGWIEAPV